LYEISDIAHNPVVFYTHKGGGVLLLSLFTKFRQKGSPSLVYQRAVQFLEKTGKIHRQSYKGWQLYAPWAELSTRGKKKEKFNEDQEGD
jgi:hypothetical protein